VNAVTLTPSARAWLSATTHARVLNTFDRACNLVNQDNALLALIASPRGLNPFSLVIDSADPAPFRGVSTASPVSVAPHHLSIGPLLIRFAGAEEWNPVPDWPAVRDCLANNPECLDELAALALDARPRGSLLELYTTEARADREQLFLERARRGVAGLAAGLSAGSLETCRAGVRELAGLGGGLTPAGDDFIVGVLLAVWAGRFGPQAEALCQPIAEAAASQTTLLSAAYLRAAARGECMRHWHAVFHALCKFSINLPLATRDLLSIGHTSGADALAGFLARDHLTHI
jgi:hypothetical protein